MAVKNEWVSRIASPASSNRRVVHVAASCRSRPSFVRRLSRIACARVVVKGLVFGQSGDRPFDPTSAVTRARKAWSAVALTSITFHECRHTYASFMIAAGANAKAISSYMGHASVTITYDRYGHLMPGNEAEAALLLDDYLASAASCSDGRTGVR